jgi:peptidoglycan/xylan/chitin deacetylase (PgdA/CDA1 family)
VTRARVLGAISVVAVVAVFATFGGAQAFHASRAGAYGDAAPICRVRTPERLVALTFDDGPSIEHTADVISLLERDEATATFFIVGARAAAHPELVRAVVVAGGELGDHSWSHPHLADVTESVAISEISRTRETLKAFGDVRFERMPYGDARAETFADVRDSGLMPIHWSIALDHYVDGLALTARAAADAFERDVRPGDIVLAHDADDGGIDRTAAIETLRLALPELADRGYRFVSVGELLAAGDPVAATRRPWFWQSGFTCPNE